MNFIYFGSFHISAAVLEHIVKAGFMPTVVICNPDRPAGRKKVLTPPAVKQLILEHSWPIKISQPEKLETRSLKLEVGEVDLAIVMGYPLIIPQTIIDLPCLGTIGVHPSLLPKYRGASPIQSVLLAGESTTGVTLYQMDSKMDHGKIIASSEWQVASGTTNTDLEKQLSKVASELLIKTMPKFVAGKITPQEQDHSQASFTQKFTGADGQVDMTKDEPKLIYRKIKAFNPEPSVWTMNFPGYEGLRIKLLAATKQNEVVIITKIQPAGKTAFDTNLKLESN